MLKYLAFLSFSNLHQSNMVNLESQTIQILTPLFQTDFFHQLLYIIVLHIIIQYILIEVELGFPVKNIIINKN